jgi:hypothetical protein
MGSSAVETTMDDDRAGPSVGIAGEFEEES